MAFTNQIKVLLPWLLFTIMAAVTMGKIGFQKDLNMDVVFPAPIDRPDPNMPTGHMRPLGWQRKSDGPVDEVEGTVSPNEFFHEYVNVKIPIVIRKALPEAAPVFDNWEDDAYILNQYSQVNVSVRVKTGRYRGKVMTSSRVMTMKKFLSEYKYEEWYLSSVVPVDMMEEIPLPSCLRCGTFSERLWAPELWMSSGGTSSRVHSHDDHLLHCVLFGRRDFILVEPMHKKAFDFLPDYSGSMGGHSDMNTEMVDMFKFSQVARVPWTWSTLLPGDCIFVPAGYIHQVRSYGRSVSMTIEFAPLKAFDDTGCTLDDDEFTPLSSAFFVWTMESGIVKLSNKNLNADDVRNIFMSLIGKKQGVSYHQFQNFYTKLSANSTKMAPAGRDVFNMLTSQKGENFLNENTLLNIPAKSLSRIADVFNSLYNKEANPPVKKQIKRRRDEF